MDLDYLLLGREISKWTELDRWLWEMGDESETTATERKERLCCCGISKSVRGCQKVVKEGKGVAGGYKAQMEMRACAPRWTTET